MTSFMTAQFAELDAHNPGGPYGLRAQGKGKRADTPAVRDLSCSV